MDNIFAQATRQKLRFQYKGEVSVEELWRVPLTELDKLAAGYEDQLEKAGTSRRNRLVKVSDEAKVLRLKVDVIDFIIKVREEEQDERTKQISDEQEIANLQDLLQKKKGEQLAGKSIEELEAMIAAKKGK